MAVVRHQKRRKRRSNGSARVIHADFGTPERHAKGDIGLERVAIETTTITDRARSHTRDPLRTYYRRKLITVDQHWGGRQLQATWEAAKLAPSLVGRYEKMPANGSNDILNGQRLEAVDRFHAALKVLPHDIATPVIKVVCVGMPCGKRWMPQLRDGLETLAQYFEKIAAQRFDLAMQKPV